MKEEISEEEKQDYLLDKIDEISKIALELANIAEVGIDANLKDRMTHIRKYCKKTQKELLQVWNLNKRIAKRRAKNIFKNE